MTTALGPFVGGYLLDHGSWRLIFLINLPLCLAVLVALPLGAGDAGPAEPRGPSTCAARSCAWSGSARHLRAHRRQDQRPDRLLVAAAVVGVARDGGVRARRDGTRGAMVPTELFASRIFSAANLMTFLVYGALGSVFFLLVLQLQVSSGFTPFQAGLAGLPVTVAMLLLSPRFAALAARTGPRLPMTFGPLLLRRRGAAAGGRRRRHVVLDGRAAGHAAVRARPLRTGVAADRGRAGRGARRVRGRRQRDQQRRRARRLPALVAALPAAVGLSGADYRAARRAHRRLPRRA